MQDLKLDVQELTPGEKYLFTVATLSDDDRQSSCVSATVCTGLVLGLYSYSRYCIEIAVRVG